jgi:hypothetical protein
MSIEDKELQNHLYELHTQLQDLLSGYADNMLDADEKNLVEAHLSGCEACRMDVVRQKLLSHRLNELPVTRMSSQLHQKLDSSLSEASTPNRNVASIFNAWQQLLRFDWLKPILATKLTMASGWGVAVMLLFVLLLPDLKLIGTYDVPMVEEALSEYRHLSDVALPAAKPHLVMNAPVKWPNSRVISHWKTTIGGAPADAFAVRTGDSIVFQFRINEAVFFHNPDVRLAVAKTGNYQMQNKELEVLALPLKKAGLLMVGPTDGIPTLAKLTFKTI